MKKDYNFVRIIVGLFSFIIVLVLGLQIYNYFYVSVRTEPTSIVTTDDTVDIEGVVCRNSTIINNQKSKFIDIILDDGEKVGRNETIANIYSDDNSANIQNKIKDLTAKIEQYNEVLSWSINYDTSDKSYDNDIYEQIMNISKFNESNGVQDSFLSAQDLLGKVLKKEIANGEITGIEEALSSLKNEKKQLQAQISGNISSIKAPVSGYFCDSIDNYETKLKNGYFQKSKISEFNSVLSKVKNDDKKDDAVLGKIIDSDHWELYANVSYYDVSDYEVGDTIYLSFPSIAEDKVKFTITTFNREGENVLLGAETNILIKDIFSLRYINAKLVKKSYTGLKVNKKALHIKDGKNGVYVRASGKITFYNVEVLFSNEDFAVLKYDNSDPKALKLYDEVVIRGRNLYDGKAV